MALPRTSKELLTSLAIALVAFLPAWLRMGHLFTHDWHYFNNFSWIIRSNVLHYGRFPLHDPWFCGGLDLVQNPQNRIFSPMGWLDLAAPPQWANLLALTIYAFFGAWGMIRLLTEEFAVAFPPAAVASALFIGSSWFGLHFAEGHIPYGAFQLLPWIYLLGRRAGRGDRLWRSLFALSLLFALMILDGGIYAFAFSLLLLATIPWPREALREIFTKPANLGRLALLGIACLCLSLGKMYPVLLAIRHRAPLTELNTMSPHLLALSFFYPWQKVDLPTDPGFPLYFHELGCYIGFLCPLLILAVWWKNRAIFRARGAVRLLLPAFLFLWMGSGILGEWNLWNAFRHIPILNNLHVQSRLFLLFLILFLIFLAIALDRIRARSRAAFAVIAGLVLVEFAVVRVSSFSLLAVSGGEPIGATEMIESTTISQTVAREITPAHLRAGNLGTRDCYEPTFMSPKVEQTGTPTYRGEAYVAAGMGQVTLASFTPGRIEADYSATTVADIGFNTRMLAGWVALSPPDAVVRAQVGSGLLGAHVPPGKGQIVLAYRPRYLKPTLIFYFLGWMLFGLAAWKIRGSETPAALPTRE